MHCLEIQASNAHLSDDGARDRLVPARGPGSAQQAGKQVAALFFLTCMLLPSSVPMASASLVPHASPSGKLDWERAKRAKEAAAAREGQHGPVALSLLAAVPHLMSHLQPHSRGRLRRSRERGRTVKLYPVQPVLGWSLSSFQDRDYCSSAAQARPSRCQMLSRRVASAWGPPGGEEHV
jgi:hypothetical protein